MELLSKAFSVCLSYLLLLALVNIVAPFQLLSISNLDIHPALMLLMSILLVDFFHYLSHRLMHLVPWFWKLHRLHHSDKHVDAITSFIHHPFEVVSVFIVNVPLYVLFDVPVEAIFYHSMLMVTHSPFTHTSLKLPEKFDTLLSYFIVTPNFHRVHHSLDMKEGNSSFGIVFPFWDRLFKTLISKSAKEIYQLKFGIKPQESPKKYSAAQFLINPLK